MKESLLEGICILLNSFINTLGFLSSEMVFLIVSIRTFNLFFCTIIEEASADLTKKVLTVIPSLVVTIRASCTDVPAKANAAQVLANNPKWSWV